MTKCRDFKLLNSFSKLTRKKEVRKHFILMTDHIKDCETKFDSNDICLNGNNCTEKVRVPIFGDKKAITYKVDCKCPIKHSFKCDQYFCTRNLEGCHYFEQNYNFNFKINKCGNDGVSTLKSFSSWAG